MRAFTYVFVLIAYLAVMLIIPFSLMGCGMDVKVKQDEPLKVIVTHEISLENLSDWFYDECQRSNPTGTPAEVQACVTHMRDSLFSFLGGTS